MMMMMMMMICALGLGYDDDDDDDLRTGLPKGSFRLGWAHALQSAGCRAAHLTAVEKTLKRQSEAKKRQSRDTGNAVRGQGMAVKRHWKDSQRPRNGSQETLGNAPAESGCRRRASTGRLRGR